MVTSQFTTVERLENLSLDQIYLGQRPFTFTDLVRDVRSLTKRRQLHSYLGS